MYLGLIILMVEVLFVIHAIRNGHGYGWILLILFFPMIGCLVYLLMIILPDMMNSRAITASVQNVKRKIDPESNIRSRFQELDDCNSVANKLRLANEYMESERYEDAISVYESSLKGSFKNDAEILFLLSKAYFYNRQPDKTRETLDHLNNIHPDEKSGERRILYCMSLEALGKNEEALKNYEELCPNSIGPEAKYRYALLLKRTGNAEAASRIFHDIVSTAKRMNRYYRKIHKQWISLAKKEA